MCVRVRARACAMNTRMFIRAHLSTYLNNVLQRTSVTVLESGVLRRYESSLIYDILVSKKFPRVKIHTIGSRAAVSSAGIRLICIFYT